MPVEVSCSQAQSQACGGNVAVELKTTRVCHTQAVLLPGSLTSSRACNACTSSWTESHNMLYLGTALL